MQQEYDARRTVVGAVIVAGPPGGRTVLAARRTRPAALAGRWEFPGGKVEPGETPEAALVREVREELGATVLVGHELADEGRPWPISEVHELRLFAAIVVDGEPVPGADHDEVRWLRAEELDDVDWLDSDAQAIDVVANLLVETPPPGAQ